MIQEFTISAFTENHIGLLNRVTIIFTRRHINIESLTVSASAIPGVHKFTIVVNATEEQVIKVVNQIDKVVDVLKSFYYLNEEIIHREIALYKIPTEVLVEGTDVEQLVFKYNARILEVTPTYAVIQKTGFKDETQELFEQLKKFKVLQFTRSGRIAVTKHNQERLSEFLSSRDAVKDKAE